MEEKNHLKTGSDQLGYADLMHSPSRTPALTGRVRIRVLSLGAGIQSSTLLLLACASHIPTFDAAVFADTQWESAAVYEHLARLEQHANDAGIPVYRVTAGNIRTDALDPQRRFASMPLYSLGPDGRRGMGRRQCTKEYKIGPIKAKVRELLGYPPPARVPRGIYAEQAIGFSVDEIGRVRDADVRYVRNVFPLLDLGWTRQDCRTWLTSVGFGDTPRSACLGCPYHGNKQWRAIRDTDPQAWADVVAFDHAIRHGHARANNRGQYLRGHYFVHSSRRPLDEAPLDTPSRDRDEKGHPDGCSPWSCRSGERNE